MNINKDKESIQESQYTFPYHYLTNKTDGVFSLARYLNWGLIQNSYIEYVAEKASAINISSVLDAGCGDGRMIYEIAKTKPLIKYTGIDISLTALKFAKAFNPYGNFITHDILSRPLKEKHELCISVEVIEHIKPNNVKLYVKQIYDSLEKDGHFILTTPTINQPVHKKHYQHFTLKTLEEAISPYFNIIEVEYLNVENKLASLLSRLLANKYFILNSKTLRNIIYNLYMKYCFRGDKETGTRILIYATKK